MKEIINHSNYEDYFLLYVDDELDFGERKAVELFVAQYPHLKPELDVLLQTRIKADTAVSFAGKGGLLREESFISDEAILLYLDGAPVDDHIKTALQHPTPALQQRMDLFRKTIATPDMALVFTDKNALYKRAGAVRIYNWKIAAAAAILLLVAGYGFLHQRKEQGISTTDFAGLHLGKTGINTPGINNRAISSPLASRRTAIDTVPAQKESVLKQKETQVNSRGADGQQTPGVVQAKPATQSIEPAPGQVSHELLSADIPAIASTQDPGTSSIQPEGNTNNLTNAGLVKAAVVKEPSVKEKKSLFKKLIKRIEDRVADSFDEGADQVTVAGFAFNVKQRR